MLKSSLCDYSDGTITITGDAGPKPVPPPALRTQTQTETARRNNERKKRVIIKNCAPFTDCISDINNT